MEPNHGGSSLDARAVLAQVAFVDQGLIGLRPATATAGGVEARERAAMGTLAALLQELAHALVGALIMRGRPGAGVHAALPPAELLVGPATSSRSACSPHRRERWTRSAA